MKKKISLLIMFLVLALPVSAKAASVSVSLNCPSSAKASSTVSCTVSATPSGADLKGIQANISVTGGKYASFSLGSGWTAYSNSAAGFSLGRNTAVTKAVTVGTLKITMPSSGSATVSLTNVAGSASDYSTLSGNSPSQTIRVQSNVNTLKSLSLSTGTLSPAFNANTTSYTATVDDSSVTINGSVTDSLSKVTGLGKKNLAYGKNTFSVVVTSESGAKKTYTIVITRPDNRSSNNNLKSLSVDQGSISFNKNTTSYKINVDSNVTSIKVNATLEDSKASFVSGSGPRTVKLNYGDNKIQVKVKAENESVKTYTITVNRKDNRSSDSSLKSLSVSPAEINFNKGTTTYNTTVPYEVTSVKVEYKVNDSKAKAVVSGSEKLSVGSNKIIVKVTAENGTSTTYTVNITRQKEGEKVLNNDSSLKSLIINGKEVKLDDKLTYIVELDEEGEASIKAEANQTTSSVNVSSDEKLVDGSIVSVTVTAEDGSSTTYLASCIVKDAVVNEVEVKENNLLNYVLVVIVTILVTEVINFIIFKKLLKK